MLHETDHVPSYSVRWIIHLLYIPWGGSFILLLFPRGTWHTFSKHLSHICLRGPNSILEVPLPSISRFLLEVPFALEVLISSSRCYWLRGPNSLLEVCLPLSSWFLARGAITLKSWLLLWGALIFKILNPSSKPSLALEVLPLRGALPLEIPIPSSRWIGSPILSSKCLATIRSPYRPLGMLASCGSKCVSLPSKNSPQKDHWVMPRTYAPSRT